MLAQPASRSGSHQNVSAELCARLKVCHGSIITLGTLSALLGLSASVSSMSKWEQHECLSCGLLWE